MSLADISPGGTTEVAILGRLFLNGERELSRGRARYLLELRNSDDDKARMHELALKNQDGLLSAAERDELLGYAKAGCLLGILHSKARRALRKPSRPHRS